MKPATMTAFILLVGVSAVWLAATIAPPMLAGSVCGAHGPALYEHCWRCPALPAAGEGLLKAGA